MFKVSNTHYTSADAQRIKLSYYNISSCKGLFKLNFEAWETWLYLIHIRLDA